MGTVTSMSALPPTCYLVLLNDCSHQCLKSFVRGNREGMDLRDGPSSKH